LGANGYQSQQYREEYHRLLSRRKDILAKKEENWSLKSKAIWLDSGDEKIIFFHTYAKGIKIQNSI